VRTRDSTGVVIDTPTAPFSCTAIKRWAETMAQRVDAPLRKLTLLHQSTVALAKSFSGNGQPALPTHNGHLL
jgi:hypothetical protein